MPIRCRGIILFAALLLAGFARPAAAQHSSAPIQNPANGHWYQVVRVAGAISWDGARAAAASLSHAGYPGHLLAISSEAENEFIARNVLANLSPDDRLWLGGYQDGAASDYLEPRGGWRWVTGEPWSFTRWLNGEPNNYGGNEDAIEFHGSERWNDFPRSTGLNGYVVEYEPAPIAIGPLLTVTPNSVMGGQPTTGQVILAQPAGLGGVVVTLSSSNPAAAVVPASITVPTGANAFSFPVTTFPVASPADATITVRSPGGDASVSLRVLPAPSPPAPVYNPANGHWYQLIPVPREINWPDARKAAEAVSFAGYRGHLATITSADESRFITAHVSGDSGLYAVWLGGYQDNTAPDYREPDGGWRWVTGEPFQFTNWHSGEPNDSPRNSNALQLAVIWGGEWDDRLANEALLPGYVVEFEPGPGVSPAPVPPQPVYNPANGHWYQVVMPSEALSWQQAREAAATLSYAGLRGHLATVTSLAENQFIWDHVIQHNPSRTDYLLGGYQDRSAPDYREPGGGWRWVTGEPWSFTRWASIEPNNTAGIEDVLGYWGPQLDHWNDFNPAPRQVPFIVEYEPQPAPAAAIQLVLFPNPVPGGLLALGQATLSEPAGAGGATLALTSSHPGIAVVPPTVSVSPGAATVTFPILTYPVSAAIPVQITAGHNGGAATTTLHVLPFGSAPPPLTPAGNLLVNGSFEAPGVPVGGFSTFAASRLPGWRISRGTVDVLGNGSWRAAPGQGDQSLDLVGTPGAATIEQSFLTEVGREYIFSGYVSHNPGVTFGRADVLLNGVPFVQLAHNQRNTNADMKWQFFSYRFRATATITTLTITDITRIDNLQGTALDGLSVTSLGDADPPVNSVAPAAPTGLAATRVLANQVTLTWTDNSDNESHFILWRRTGGGEYIRIGHVGANVTTFTDSGVQPQTTYTYQVRSWNPTGSVSPRSNELTVTTPAAPPNAPTALVATPLSATEMELRWQDNSRDEAVFVLWRQGPGTAFERIGSVPANTTRFLDRGLRPGTLYRYQVRAWNPQGGPSSRAEASATTPLAQ